MNGAELLLGPAALERHGRRTALICGEEALSFPQLAATVARAAAAFAALGVRPGDRVLILMRDTPEFAAAWLGAVRAGAVAVALNDRLSDADYRHILADSGARLALIEDTFAAGRPDLTAELAREQRIVVTGAVSGLPSWRKAQEKARAMPPFDAYPETPAFLLYSSGTTGRPKGIVHVHRLFASLGFALREAAVDSGAVFSTKGAIALRVE